MVRRGNCNAGVDGTLLYSHEEGEDNFEAKLGIMYSGKEMESKKAEHKGYRFSSRGR